MDVQLNTLAPRIGDHVTVNGHECEVIKVHDFGTIDVVSLDSDHAWRVTGLSFLKAPNV